MGGHPVEVDLPADPADAAADVGGPAVGRGAVAAGGGEEGPGRGEEGVLAGAKAGHDELGEWDDAKGQSALAVVDDQACPRTTSRAQRRTA